MTTATQNRKPARKPQPRTAHVTRLGDAFILWLTVGKDTTAYRVLPLDSQLGGVAFRLEKADRGDGQPEVYNVLLNGEHSLCECRGFLQHGMCHDGKGCKHIAGLTAAVAAKQLSVPTVKQEPVMVNAEEPMAAVLLGGERHRQEMAQRQPWCEHCNDTPDVFCSHCSL